MNGAMETIVRVCARVESQYDCFKPMIALKVVWFKYEFNKLHACLKRLVTLERKCIERCARASRFYNLARMRSLHETLKSDQGAN